MKILQHAMVELSAEKPGCKDKIICEERKKFPFRRAAVRPGTEGKTFCSPENHFSPIQDATVSPMTSFCVFSETPAFLSFIS